MSPISAFRQNDPYEQLIQQMLVIESEPKERLVEQKSTQSRIKNVISDVDSNLSALFNVVKSFKGLLSNPFDAKSASVSDGAGYSISAGSGAAFGSHSLEVLRLASTDTRISRQMIATGGELRTFFDVHGEQSFSIEVAHPTEADPNHRESIDVTVDPAGTTDEEILDELRSAIKVAMDDAIAAGIIERDEGVHAAVVSETSSTSRLSVKSGQTGFTNRLTFGDSADGLLAALELNAGGVAAGAGGGQVTDVGTNETDTQLNSRFTLDGLTLYRDTNSVDDALADVTILLTESGLGRKDFNVAADKDSIKGEIEDFIKKYNTIVTHLQSKTDVDGEAGTRGDLAGDSTFRGLRFGLRNDVAGRVAGQPAEGPFMLTNLGIEINDDGTLVLDDVDELLGAVERDAGSVESLFSGADGIATRLQDRIDAFVGTGGILKGRLQSIDTTVRRLDHRIESWDEKLAAREDSLRMQFARMQESIARLQGQQQNMSSFFGGIF